MAGFSGVRRSVRWRLTVLYGVLFLVSGAVLLGITYGLVAGRSAAIVGNTRAVIVGPGDTMPSPFPGFRIALGGAPLNGMASTQVKQLVNQKVSEASAGQLRLLLIVSAVALGIMVVVSVVLGWLMAGRTLRPVRQMTAKARRISEDNLHERLAVSGPDDELKDLGDTFDGLLGRLDAAFEAQKRFVANASHELRTPLTVQRAMIEVALSDPDTTVESLRAVCERVLASGEDQARLLDALLTLARGQRGLDRQQAVDLAATAASVIRQTDTRTPPVRITADLAPAWLRGDPRLVTRLLTNLVDNAVRHNLPDGGWVRVSTRTRGSRCVLRVVNSGPEIPPDRIADLLEPFQRMESRTAHGGGYGLGLSIVAAIARAHHADLSVQPAKNGGLDISVRFATADPPPNGHGTNGQANGAITSSANRRMESFLDSMSASNPTP